MKSFIVLAFCLALSSALQNTEFETFKRKFGKVYRSAIEERFREKTFLENLKVIEEHNALYQQGKSTFTLGINEFSDLTGTEFAENYFGYSPSVDYKPKNVHVSKLEAVPNSIDWRLLGYVTPVKNQLQCGSCWAFSATGAIEGQHFKSTGQLVSLSEQHLIDCSRAYGNNGCSGGWMNSAFRYVIDNRGIAKDSLYPYEAKDGICRYHVSQIGATVRFIKDVAKGDEGALKAACAENGPISVAIDASGINFQNYKSGIYNNPACSSQVFNHGVLVVGYGSEDGQDYWLVKNSWGIYWGENGYMKMSRNKNNQCGIATAASYPLV